MNTCNICCHYNRLHNQCAAHSPTAIVLMGADGNPKIIGVWPPTKSDNWCGEYAAMTEEQQYHAKAEAAHRAHVVSEARGNGLDHAE